MLRTIPIFALTVLAAADCRPQVQIQAVVNTASFQPGVLWPTNGGSAMTLQGMPSGGALATVFVSGLRLNPGTFAAPSASPLPFNLGGVEVSVNGALAPILSVYIPRPGDTANAQINFQVPLERNAFSSVGGNVIPTVVNVAGATFAVPLYDQPLLGMGGFFSDANGYAIALHASDSSLVTPQNPAHAGESIIAYADDFFDVWPPPPIGFPVPAQPSFTYNQSLVTDQFLFAVAPNTTMGVVGLYLQDYPTVALIQGIPGAGPYGFFTNTPALQITYEGLAVGQIGVEEIHFVVPQNQAPGDWALFFNSGSCLNGEGPRCTVGAEMGISSAYVKLPVR